MSLGAYTQHSLLLLGRDGQALQPLRAPFPYLSGQPPVKDRGWQAGETAQSVKCLRRKHAKYSGAYLQSQCWGGKDTDPQSLLVSQSS